MDLLDIIESQNLCLLHAKNGRCKHKKTCTKDHPKDVPDYITTALKGDICIQFLETGTCTFQDCKFEHIIKPTDNTEVDSMEICLDITAFEDHSRLTKYYTTTEIRKMLDEFISQIDSATALVTLVNATPNADDILRLVTRHRLKCFQKICPE